MRFVCTLVLLLFIQESFASPAEEPKVHSIRILDAAQAFFGARANFAADRLDSFFATERADDEFGRSRIRIRSIYSIRERALPDLTNQYRINLKLPHLEEKFKFEYYQDKKDKKDKDKAAKSAGEIPTNHTTKPRWIFNSDIGVSAAIPPKLVTRARLRRNFEVGPFIHRFAEQLTFITDESGLLEETQFLSDYSFNPDLLFRFVNIKQWRVLKKEFTTNHGPTLLHRVTDDDAFNYGITMASVITEGAWFVNNYRAAVNYRRNLYRQWCYLDVITGLDFPKVWSFRRTPFITFQLELLFGS